MAHAVTVLPAELLIVTAQPGPSGVVVVAARGEVAGARLRVVAHSYPVLLPLAITGLDRVFDIYPALGDASPFPGGGPNG